jgi:methyl-accepting chemotaxis protein
MKWFNDRTIRAKMIIGFGVVIALAIALAVIALMQMTYVTGYYQDVLNGAAVRRGAANSIQGNMMAFRRTVANSVMVAPLEEGYRIRELNALQTEANTAYTRVVNYLNIYEESVRTQPDRDDAWRNNFLGMSKELRDLFDKYRDILNDVQHYARLGDYQSAYNATEISREVGSSLVALTTEMSQSADTAMDEGAANAAVAAGRARTLVTAITVGIVLLAVVIAFAIAQFIAKPVQDLLKLTTDVSKGNLNINMDRTRITRDEIGMLTADVYNVVDVIKNIVQEIGVMATEIDKNGDLDYRVNANKYHGAYADMVVRLNELSNGFVKDITNLRDVLDKVGNGDFTFKLERLPGKKVAINQSVDNLKANLDSVSDGIKQMIDAASVQGNMRFKLESNKFMGGWKSIMEGLNQIAAAVDKPVAEIMEIMNNLSQGNFLQKVNGMYPGDFKQMKDAVNNTIDQLNIYIDEISKSLASVAGGDLTVSIRRDYVGSFGAIKESINNISQTLNKTMSDINSAASQVLMGSRQISASAIDLANGAQEQASSVEELNASIDVINEQTRQNAQSAQEASDLSLKSAENANHGNETMKQMLVAMNQIKDSSNEISKIIKLISDTTFQTNLLSLNASVEAARAGEHGRGFAVVADEVRNLANKSKQSTETTTVLINESINRVDAGAAIAEQTNESLSIIVKNASEILELIKGISKSSIDQAESINQVSIGLAQISSVIQANSATSEETAAASQELNSQAEILQQLVSYFRM